MRIYSYTNKASKINTGNNPLLFFGLSGISVVFPVIRVFPVSLGTRSDYYRIAGRCCHPQVAKFATCMVAPAYWLKIRYPFL